MCPDASHDTIHAAHAKLRYSGLFSFVPAYAMANMRCLPEMLAQEDNFNGLARINRELIAKVEALDSAQRVVLDMDSTEILVYGDQEHSAHNGHFESTCYLPLLLFNREGDCLAVKFRSGNVHRGLGRTAAAGDRAAAEADDSKRNEWMYTGPNREAQMEIRGKSDTRNAKHSNV